jgi:hypothetical protein
VNTAHKSNDAKDDNAVKQLCIFSAARYRESSCSKKGLKQLHKIIYVLEEWVMIEISVIETKPGNSCSLFLPDRTRHFPYTSKEQRFTSQNTTSIVDIYFI